MSNPTTATATATAADAARAVFKRGDTIIVVTENGTVFVGNAMEKISETSTRVYFSFLEDGKIFDSSVFAKPSEIRQIVRNGIAIWFNRG